MARSKRNKTIQLETAELERLRKKLISLKEPVSLDQVLNKTIVQDASAALPFLPDHFVDLLFIDPPYNLHKTFRSSQFKKMAIDDYERWVRSWMVKLLKKLKSEASIYVCGDWNSSPALYRVLSDFFIIQNRITWQREKGRGAKSNWKNASEDIWFATVSKDYYFDVEPVKLKKRVVAPYRDDGREPKDWKEEAGGNFRLTHPSNIWTDITVPFWSMAENTEHPTQKPEKLLAKIILASSKPGDLVFDPFLGSGTTSVVAKKLGRRYLGIEEDAYYACLAEKRLEMAEDDGRIQGYENGVFWERNVRKSEKNAD